MAAVAAVFALPELHEAILHHIDMTTLLVSAQRVSKALHDLITTSPTLQQKLFFKPIPDDACPTAAAVAASAANHHDGVEEQVAMATTPPPPPPPPPPPLTRNPLLVKYFSPCFFEKRRKAYFRQANSFLAMPWTARPRRERLDKEGIMRRMKLEPPEDAYLQPFRDRFFRTGASWRRMLVAQPPVRQLGCLWSNEAYAPFVPDRRYSATIRGTVVALAGDASPLRMGRLYDLVQERLCRHETHCLWFRVHWDAMRRPDYCEASRLRGQQLFAQTRVVVEFVAQDQPSAIPKEPADPEVFDNVFRCDEHEPVEIVFVSDDAERRVAWPDHHRQGILSKFAAVYEDKREL